MRKKKAGPTRMKELGRVKIEVWLSEAQMKEFDALAEALKLPRATLARRACNYAARGGVGAMQALRGLGYD
jgi:hypothetical protein